VDSGGLVQKIKDYQIIVGLIIAAMIAIGFRVITPQTVAEQTNKRFERVDSAMARTERSHDARFEAMENAGDKRDAQLEAIQRELRTIIRLECLDRANDQRSMVFLDCSTYLGR
jgi:hypothetical protein